MQYCLRFVIFRELDATKKSIEDSDVPLLWWNVGAPVACVMKEKDSQKLLQDSCLLDVDFDEQLESVPITVLSTVEACCKMY